MDILELGSNKIHYLLIFLFILLANFIGDVSSCSLRLFLNKNMIAKHVVAFFTLLLFVTVELYENSHIYTILTNTVLMYICFILLMRTYYVFTFVSLGLIAICYILTLHINYLKKQDKSIEEIKKYENIRTNLFIISLISIVIGFIYNIKFLNDTYKNKFSINRYLIGLTNEECFKNK
jgi:hypothetical protein